MRLIITAPGWSDRGTPYRRGDIVDVVPGERAEKLIRHGIARPAPAEKKAPVPVETTEAAPPPENAAKRTAKPAPRKK